VSIDTDVLVIGAGASGGALSWRLASHGVRVTCLEQGDWVDRALLPSMSDDWEAIRSREWHPNPNVRALPTDYPVDHRDCPMRPLMFNGVGGSTVMWSCHAPRFHPSDFRVRTLDGVADDWPLDYTELAPYYDLNDRMSGHAGLAGDPAMPERPARTLPPAGLTPGDRRMIAAFERLGWHWWPADLAFNTRAADGRGECNNCGPCEIGCPRRAKSSADLTYWPLAMRHGARLITRARVAEITLDARGRASGAVYFDASGARQRARAAVVVLAANGVGTPRLLLLSRIANSSGLVGRNLMLHPLARVAGVFDEPVYGHRGIAAGAIVSKQFYETDASRGFVRGLKLQLLRSHGPALVALGSTVGRLQWGREHHRQFLSVFDRTVSVSICADDLPEPDNRVALHDTLRDSNGLPAPAMIYRLGENSRRILEFGVARAKELLTEAGARIAAEWNLIADAGFHLMGTARMGDDPERSVVDRWGRAHDVPNLFVIDGSVFVTAAAVNPTHTIQALALRAADQIIATRRGLRPKRP
jgi:choline dehydrogenase-like flavoprotein